MVQCPSPFPLCNGLGVANYPKVGVVCLCVNMCIRSGDTGFFQGGGRAKVNDKILHIQYTHYESETNKSFRITTYASSLNIFV